MKNRKSQKKRSQPVCPEIKDQQIHQLVFQGKFPARRNLPCLIRISILKKKFSPPVQSAELEENTVGQEMILDPVQVEFTQGESCADVVFRGMAEHNITPIYTWNSSYGFYLSGIKNCDSGTVNLPDCIKKVMTECETWTGDSLELTANKYAPDLPAGRSVPEFFDLYCAEWVCGV